SSRWRNDEDALVGAIDSAGGSSAYYAPVEEDRGRCFLPSSFWPRSRRLARRRFAVSCACTSFSWAARTGGYCSNRSAGPRFYWDILCWWRGLSKERR